MRDPCGWRPDLRAAFADIGGAIGFLDEQPVMRLTRLATVVVKMSFSTKFCTLFFNLSRF